MTSKTKMRPLAAPALLCVLAAFAAGWLGCSRPAEQAAAPEKPNILLFVTDDESWLERSAYGWSKLPTPNFDRVARDGVLFTRGYTSAPSCAPSRASLLTGRNFWELEEGAFIQAWLPEKFPVLPDLLAKNGYHVGHTGKGWGPGVNPPGGPERWPAGPAYSDVQVSQPEPQISKIDYAANFEKFLEQGAAEQPFFFWAGLTEPHGPWAEGNEQKLAERCGFDLNDTAVPGFLEDTPKVRQQRAQFLYEICYADNQLGRFLETLEKRGDLENTLLIVTADNGTGMRHSKATAYDWGVHVPLAIMWPARAPGGRKVDDFVKFPDLAATTLEAAGAEVPSGMTGRSILDILVSEKSGQVDPARDWVATGLEWHGEFDPQSRSSRSIRDKRYAYIVNYGNGPDGGLGKPTDPADAPSGRVPEELYDLEKDPWQLHNLIDDPKFAEIKRGLAEKLAAYQRETNDPRVTGNMETFQKTRQFVQERKRAGYPK